MKRQGAESKQAPKNRALPVDMEDVLKAMHPNIKPTPFRMLAIDLLPCWSRETLHAVILIDLASAVIAIEPLKARDIRSRSTISC